MPADEGLDADRVAAREGQDRLVGQQQLLAGEGVAQQVLDLHVRAQFLAQAGVEHLQSPAAGALGLVHRQVGLAQHRLGVAVGVPRDGHADACQHRDFGGAQRERLLEGVEDPSGESHRLGLALDFLGQDHELVAAQAGDRVAVAHQLGQALGDGNQQPVAGVVAEVVVDGLELVQVDEQHRQDAFRAVQPRHRLMGAVHQQHPVRQPGEGVVHRLALQPHPVGHVLGGRVPGLAVAPGAPQQPVPGAVAVAVAGREVLDLGGVAVAGPHRAEQLLGVVGVDEVGHRTRLQFLASPAEQLLPCRVEQGEAPIQGDRREQVAGHLEQAGDAGVAAGRLPVRQAREACWI